LALLGTNIFFAINFSAIKSLIDGGFVLPFGLNMARMFGATALLWVLYLLKPNKQPIKKWHYSRFFWCSILGVTINQLFFIKGLSMTHTIHASLLMLTTPIIITVIAAWILKERLTWNKIIGLTLGVGGATVLIMANKIDSKDYDGWIQERGLYFAEKWSDKYTSVYSIKDSGETEQEGSLLYTQYGKGTYIFTGLSFFRQLPAGVPGAFRLMANLISFNKK